MQKSKLWILLFTLALPAFAGAAAATPAPQVSRPNIIVMLADDLGYGDLGCYGATQVKTPNIDRLAKQGVRLTDAHATAAVCQPSRYAVLTGRYHWRAKNTGEGFYFQDNEILMPAVLRDAGYATAALGKWHLGWNLPGKTTNQTWMEASHEIYSRSEDPLAWINLASRSDAEAEMSRHRALWKARFGH